MGYGANVNKGMVLKMDLFSTLQIALAHIHYMSNTNYAKT